MPKDDRSEAEKLADAEARIASEMEAAHRATTILDDPYFRNKCQKIRDEIYREFAQSPLEDDHARTIARHRLEGLNSIIRELTHDENTGKMARVALAEIEETRERRKRRQPKR